MAATRALLLVITMSWMHAVADPRCLVRTMYQAQPVVFLCYGSGDSCHSDNSEACDEPVTTVAVRGGNALELFDIPVGTKDFRMSFRNIKGNFHVWNPVTGTYLLDDTIINGLPKKSPTGEQNSVKEYSAIAAGANFTFKEISGPAISKQIIQFKGKTTAPITLRLENPSSLENVYRLRYHYAPYDEGAQCKFGGHGVGCKPYYQQGARTLAVQYAEWLHATYTNAEGAWHYLSVTALHSGAGQGRRLLVGGEIPNYRWCELYVKWPDAINTDCQKVYKFITHGGLEANTLSVRRENFDFLWKLPYLKQFADGCCGKLRLLWKTYAAFVAADQADTGHVGHNVGDRIWSQCDKLQPTPKKEVYFAYLDADGYQGVLPKDLEYCWDPRSSPTKKVCTWQMAPGCVQGFTFQGQTFNGCTTGDRLSVWCSMDAAFAGKWRLCTSVCTDVAAPGCHWQKNPDCVSSFAYDGVTYKNDQCATVDHYQGWCSTTAAFTTFSHDWRHCSWVCPGVGVATTTTWKEVTVTSTAPAPHSCPANSNATNCFENGGADADCCAKQGTGSCATGYTYNQGGLCQGTDFYKTCCISQAVATTTGASTSANQCTWALGAGCVANFTLAGVLREGCVMDHPEVSSTPWCSTANPYVSGKFQPCVSLCGGTTELVTTSHTLHPGVAIGIGLGTAAGAGMIAAGIASLVHAKNKENLITIPTTPAPAPMNGPSPAIVGIQRREEGTSVPPWVAPVCIAFFCVALVTAAIALCCCCSRRKSRGNAYAYEDGHPLMYDDGFD